MESFVTSNNECLCPPGYTLEGDGCVLCAPGFYKNYTGIGACEKCNAANGVWGSITTNTPAVSVLDCTCSKSDVRVLEPDSEVPLGYIGSCLACPLGSACDEAGISVETMTLKLGYWRSGNLSHNLVQCYTADACTHPNATLNSRLLDTDDQCSEGHHGPMCNVCQDNYAKSVTGVCELCVYETAIPDEMFIFLGAVLVLSAIFVTFVRRRNKKKREKKLKKAPLADGDDLSASSKKLNAIQRLALVKEDKKHWANRIKTKFKILASFYQIVSQFESILNVRYPASFERFGRLMSKFANLDALNITKMGCIVHTNFYHKLVVSTIGPICASVSIFVIMFVLKVRSKTHEDKQSIIDSAVALFLALTYMVFASVSTTIFDTFNCKNFGDDPTEYMMSDQSIDCGTVQHKLFQLFAGIMMLVYPIGIPTLYFVLLLRARDRLKAKKREDDETLHKTAFLWDMVSLKRAANLLFLILSKKHVSLTPPLFHPHTVRA
jgi:NADH:ubiquinone oxidoreductase subunit 6 (subunit J)